MITTAAWVPRGFAAPFPQKYDFDEDEFERIASLAKLKLDDANEDLEEAQKKNSAGKDSDDEESDDDEEPAASETKAESKAAPGAGSATSKNKMDE